MTQVAQIKKEMKEKEEELRKVKEQEEKEKKASLELIRKQRRRSDLTTIGGTDQRPFAEYPLPRRGGVRPHFDSVHGSAPLRVLPVGVHRGLQGPAQPRLKILGSR